MNHCLLKKILLGLLEISFIDSGSWLLVPTVFIESSRNFKDMVHFLESESLVKRWKDEVTDIAYAFGVPLAAALKMLLHCDWDQDKLSTALAASSKLAFGISLSKGEYEDDLCFVCQRDSHSSVVDGLHLSCADDISSSYVRLKKLRCCPSRHCFTVYEVDEVEVTENLLKYDKVVCPSCNLSFCPECQLAPHYPLAICEDMLKFKEGYAFDDLDETTRALEHLDSLQAHLNQLLSQAHQLDVSPEYVALWRSFAELQSTLDDRKKLVIHFGYHPSSILLLRSRYSDVKVAFDELTSAVELALGRVIQHVRISDQLGHAMTILIILRTTLIVKWSFLVAGE